MNAFTRLSRASRRGFTAAELMVVVALIGIMLLITTPAMLNFFSAMKVRTGAHRLMSHMRLCRQVAVSRRNNVVMRLQRSTATATPTYNAWEEKNGDLIQDPDGLAAGGEDDEVSVVVGNSQLHVDKVTFVNSFNDITPLDPTTDGAVIMNAAGVMYLRFSSNGQVLRLNDAGNPPSPPDTLVRMRLEREITGSRIDRWDVTVNRSGKVGSEYTKRSP